MITSPSVISSSSSGMNAWIRSAVSTMITATGRSSERLRMRVVCTCWLAPYPSIPRSTEAPARPAR